MGPKSKLAVSELKSHLGYRLRVVSNAVSHRFAQRLAACDVTVAEWVILREMYSADDTISPSAISDLTGLTRGAVSKLVNRLLEKRLVTRAESRTDRRYQEIRLTAEGVRLVPKLAAIADKNDASYFSVLSESERKNLFGILEKLARHHQLNTNPIE